MLRAGCIWLIEQGIETVGAGRARLRREAARAAELYGVHLPPAWTAPVPASTERVGRNEPCPCGSGRKYKKCSGSATG